MLAVQRVDEPSPAFANAAQAQRIATLLTPIAQGNPNNPLKSSLEVVQDTMRLYANFNDLLDYKNLRDKQTSGSVLMPEEQAIMKRVALRPALQPFLPM